MEPFNASVVEMNDLKKNLDEKGGHHLVTQLCDSINQRFASLTQLIGTRLLKVQVG